MSIKLRVRDRLKLIRRAQDGDTVRAVCREAGISRTLFYRWQRRYRKGNGKISALLPKTKLCTHLRNTYKLSAFERLLIIERVKKGESVAKVCAEFGVSRTLLYRWLNRYEKAKKGDKLEVLRDKKPFIKRHYRRAPEQYEKAVLSAVCHYPELSSHKLVWVLPQIGGRPILTNHGVQNVLARHHLTMYHARLIYARKNSHVRYVGTFVQFSKAVLSSILLQDVRARRFAIRVVFIGALALFTTIAGWGVYSIATLIPQTEFTFSIGIIFAFISFVFGMLFFLYSLKYYMTIAVVLSFSRHGQEVEEQEKRSFWQRLFGIVQEKRRNIFSKSSLEVGADAGYQPGAGLRPDLSSVVLERHPFVSIHLATYNEKRVVERLLRAVTSMEYQGREGALRFHSEQGVPYEVVIVDDSTDETTEMIKEYMGRFGKVENHLEGVASQHLPGEVLRVEATLNTPAITLIHRKERTGFKGGALKEALRVSDARSEFVMVFDADFIPYPDTITMFLKYFKSLCGSLTFSPSSTFLTHPRGGVATQSNAAGTFDVPPAAHPGGENSPIAAIQGYQWHVLNKSENWITRGVRSEYAGSYVIERSGEEIYGGLKQIAGSVYMVRRSVLESIGWGTSLTEDFELTLKLYEKGYKVVYTPYIQSPAEAVSTIKRLIRQRMRWAEGHSHNIKKMFLPLLSSSSLTPSEKLEFLYLSPYYLQAFFFMIGTLSWFISETIFHVRLPFWTEVWGWSLVATNLFALPLMNMVGLFLEESEERDYLGLFSFILLSYLVAPFQAYASVKGFLQQEEGPWFRTPKTGRITDIFTPGRFYRYVFGIFGRPTVEPLRSNVVSLVASQSQPRPSSLLSLAYSFHNPFHIRRRTMRWMGNTTLSLLLLLTSSLFFLSPFLIPSSSSYAQESPPILKKVGEIRKEEIIKNVLREEITGPRLIKKTTKGGETIEFLFHQEPRIRIKLSGEAKEELEFETKRIGGKLIQARRATIYQDKEVIYEEVLKDIDIKYRLTGDLLVEEFIIKSSEAARTLISASLATAGTVEQALRTTHVNIVWYNKDTFGFFSEEKDGKELFRLSSPFLKDKKGEVSNDVHMSLEKTARGGIYTLEKRVGESAKRWLTDKERVYPIILDPSIIVETGIVEGEVQFGGLQRKVVYMSGANGGAAWYAFYNDASDVFYKRCLDSSLCDEAADWSAAQDLDTTDADNFNPSITTSGNFIIVFWIDTSGNAIEGRRFDVSTAFAHTLGTLCTSASQGTLSSSFMLTAAAISATEAVVAYSDTSTDTEVDVFDVTGLDATCTLTDIQPGNVTFGSGITAGDRPVVVPITGNVVDMIFQDGDLSYSRMDVSVDEWARNNLTLASVTDNIYAVTSDGTTIWVLTVSGTTAATLFSCCTDDFTESQLDADAGGNGQDDVSDIDMVCPASNNCKIVYTDDIDTAAPRLLFVDCGSDGAGGRDGAGVDEGCTTSTITVLDSDIGASGDQAGASIYCVASDNCKISYGDAMDSATPVFNMIDCTADEDCSTNTNACTTSCIDVDLGDSSSILHSSVYCPTDTDCKIVYNDSGVSSLFFVDCSAANCSTRDQIRTIDTAAGTQPKNDLYCPAATDCKFVYHDSATSDFVFGDCVDADCNGPTLTIVDADVGATTGQVPVALDCSPAATDCKLLYGDQIAGDFFFVDCPDAACTATGRTITQIDATGGANASTSPSVSISCVSATDCKASYVGDLTSGSEKLYFVDCDAAACASGSVIALPGPRFRGKVVCPTTANCKASYYDGTSASNPTVQFADCDVTNCFPSSTDEADPWTAQTNVTSVSLSLDTTNNTLYAHVIKDSPNEQAYFKSSPKATISWGAETSYGFTAGDLGHISAPEKGAAPSEIGAVLRQSANFEFAVAPERSIFLLFLAPLLPGLFATSRKPRSVYMNVDELRQRKHLSRALKTPPLGAGKMLFRTYRKKKLPRILRDRI